MPQTILFVGGTGAQGAAVIRVLAATGDYRILLFTRTAESSQAKSLLGLPGVEAVINPAPHGYDLDAFETADKHSDGLFLNTDGFSVGEKAETYWGVRLFEAAVKAKVQHVVYSGLDQVYRDSGYDPKFYAGHFEAKARVQDFIQSRPRTSTAWTITRTGPYVEMLSEGMKPYINQDGVHVFTYPLGDGAIVYLHLEDYGHYIDWIFKHPARSAFRDFGIAMAHTTGNDIAEAFAKITGKPAVYQDIDYSSWADIAFADFPDGKYTKVGFRSAEIDSPGGLTYGENFRAFWNLYKVSAGNRGLIQRDYELLDEILPTRIKSIEGWMRKTDYTAENKNVLKSFRQ